MDRRIFIATFGALVVLTHTRAAHGQDSPVPILHEAESRTLSPVSAPLVTVADLIGMTTIGSRVQGYGNDDYDVPAPDGRHIAAVVKRGNLTHNSVDFALLVFSTADLLRAPKPDTVATFASSSNRPGIAHVKWLRDSRTVAFLGEAAGALPQIYTVDIRTRKLTQRSQAAAVITAFDAAADGDPMVYAIEDSRDTSANAAMRAHGFVVPPRALLSDLIAGDWRTRPFWEASEPRFLHVVRAGTETTVPVPDSATGYRSCTLGAFSTLSVAPSGDVALMQCEPLAAPPEWKGYRQKRYRRLADKGAVAREYVVVDLARGDAHALIDAPVDHTTMAWAPGGRSVVLANAMLPLGVADSAERSARATSDMLAEVDVHTGAVTVIVHRDSLSILAWDARHGMLTLAPGTHVVPGDTHRIYYSKTATGWRELPANKPATALDPTIVIDQGLNMPARLVAVDARAKDRHVIYDPNPGLLTAHRFGRETVIHWKTRGGLAVSGGLYWPPDYVPGRRYPLVIQRHGFDSTAFWPYGVYSTGEAAQPLANLGILVLQMPDPPGDVWVTPREGPVSMEEADGAIDYLDSAGVIDLANIGMQGFSRTCYYTLYFLTHSHYRLAAATLTDGVDFSYLQYMIFWPVQMGSRMPEDEKINDGKPFGRSLERWMDRAPGFNLDRVDTPLQLTALTRVSLLEEWEPYAGLLLQRKPTELVYIPDGEHILTKPWERMTSEQGAVDWYRFWLKGEEDSDSTKAEQYARWHRLRAMRDSMVVQTTRLSH